MNIDKVFSAEKGKILDCLLAPKIYLQFGSLSRLYYDLKLDEIMYQAYNRIYDRLAGNSSGIKLFWNNVHNKPSFFVLLFNDLLQSTNSFDEIISAFESIDNNELLIKLLSYYDTENNFSDNFFKLLSKNKEATSEYINTLDIPIDVKWQLAGYLNCPTVFRDRILELLNMSYEEVNKEYELNKDYIDEYYKKAEKIVSGFKDNSFFEYYPPLKNLSKDMYYTEMQFTVSFFIPYSIEFTKYDSNLNIYLGYEFYKMNVINDEHSIDNTDLFKCFSDETRASILKMISRERLSAGDVAERLNASPSSITHHLDILERANMINRRTQGKRQIFSIKKNTIKHAINELQKLI